MTQTLAMLDGSVITRDEDITAGVVALLNTWGVVEGLQVTKLWVSDFQISAGRALVVCEREGSAKVLTHFRNTETISFSATWPVYVYVHVDPEIIDNPALANSENGTGLAQIFRGDTLPEKNYLVIQQIDENNEVLPQQNVVRWIEEELDLVKQFIQWGATNYTTVSTGVTNTYELSYDPTPVASTPGDPSSISQSILFFFKAHLTNTANVVIKLETSEGTLIAPLKKMYDKDIDPGDIKEGQRLSLQRNNEGGFFQYQSQLAQIQIGSVTNNKITIITGEEQGVLAGQPAMVGEGVTTRQIIEHTGWTSLQSFGEGNKLSIKQFFLVGDDNILQWISLQMRKEASPTDTVFLKIWDEDQTTVVGESDPLSYTEFDASTVEEHFFSFDNLELEKNTRYVMELLRSGSQHATNYYKFYINNTGVDQYFKDGELKYYDGFNDILRQYSLVMRLQFAKEYEKGKRYLSNSKYARTNFFDGIFNFNKDKDESNDVTLSGANYNQSWLVSGIPYFVGEIIGEKQLDRNTNLHFGYSETDNQIMAQKFSVNINMDITKMLLAIHKTWTPLDEMVVTIEDDLNDEPNGVPIHENAEKVLSYLCFGTDYQHQIINFPWPFQLKAMKSYWIVLKRTGAMSTANYYRAKIRNSNVYDGGKMKIYENYVWVEFDYDLYFDFLQEYDGTQCVTRNDELLYGYKAEDRNDLAQSFFLNKDMEISHFSTLMRVNGATSDQTKIRIETSRSFEYEADPNDGYWRNTGSNYDHALGKDTVYVMAQAIEGDVDIPVRDVTLAVRRVWLGTDNLIIRIETDNEGIPSGTLANANAEIQFPAEDIWTGNIWRTFTFPDEFVLSGATRYRIVIKRSGEQDPVNYLILRTTYTDYNGYLSWIIRPLYFNGTDWVNTGTNHDIISFSLGMYVPTFEYPSGELADPNAEIIIDWSELTTTLSHIVRKFPAPIQLSKHQVYWIVFSRTWETHTTNYYRLGADNSWKYPYGNKLSKYLSYWNRNTEINHNVWFSFLQSYDAPASYVVPKSLEGSTWVYAGKGISDDGILIDRKPILTLSNQFSGNWVAPSTSTTWAPDIFKADMFGFLKCRWEVGNSNATNAWYNCFIWIYEWDDGVNFPTLVGEVHSYYSAGYGSYRRIGSTSLIPIYPGKYYRFSGYRNGYSNQCVAQVTYDFISLW